MKNKFCKLAAVALTAAVMAMSMSCKDNEPEPTPEPDPDPILSIAPDVTDIVFNADGVTATSGGEAINLTFKVTTNQATWDVTSTPDWVKIDINEARLEFTLSAEPAGTTAPPNAVVTVTAGAAESVTINVAQLPEGPSLLVTPLDVRNVEFPVDGGTAATTFTVVTNQSAWDAAVSPATETWLTVNKTANAFTLTAEENVGDERTATVNVTAGTAEPTPITVTQKAYGSELINAEMPFAHKEPAITNQGDKWNYAVDGGWRYNEVGGANGNVFANQAGTYNYTLSLSAWNQSAFPLKTMENAKLYQTVRLDAGAYRFTAYVLAVWGTISDAYLTAALGNDLPDMDDIGDALQSAALPKSGGDLHSAAYSIDFTLTESGLVSLGFVGNFADAEIHFSKVELIKDPVENVALNKPVTVSDHYLEFYGSYAVDGDKTTTSQRWISNAVTDEAHWLEVDLQGLFTISQVMIYFNPSGTDSNPMYRFQVWSGGAWVNVVSEDNNPWSTYLEYEFDPVTTDKVRLYIPPHPNNWTRLFEIEVYGFPAN